MQIGTKSTYSSSTYAGVGRRRHSASNNFPDKIRQADEQSELKGADTHYSAAELFDMSKFGYLPPAEDKNEVEEGNESDDTFEYTDYASIIRRKVDEMREQLKNGEVEPKFQIGALCLTEKQWDKLMAEIDAILEQIHEEIEEETEKIREEAVEKKVYEAVERQKSMLGLLNSETVRYEHISERGKKEFYITCFSKDGIYCKAPGKNGFLWHIKLKEGEYERIINFIDKFDKDSNLSFAPNQSFWIDFLNGRIDENDFEAAAYSGYGRIDSNTDVEDTDELVLGTGTRYSEYYFGCLSEFFGSLRGHISSEKNVASLSNKYDELYKSINESDMPEEEKSERIKALDKCFKGMLNIVFSNDALVAVDVIANPDKQMYNGISENKELTVEYLKNLESMLISYGEMYYESFIKDIKDGKSAEKSVKDGLSKIKEYSSYPMSYDDARDKAEELSKKLIGLYKYI